MEAVEGGEVQPDVEEAADPEDEDDEDCSKSSE